MVFDSLNESFRYVGLHPLLERAFAEVENFRLATTGVHEILGRNLFVSVQEYQTSPGAELKLENHRRYIDLQVLYSGREQVLWAPLTKVESLVPYNEKTDFEFFQGEGISFELHPGNFVIFFPSDVHRPNAQIAGQPEAVKKAVFKIKL